MGTNQTEVYLSFDIIRHTYMSLFMNLYRKHHNETAWVWYTYVDYESKKLWYIGSTSKEQV